MCDYIVFFNGVARIHKYLSRCRLLTVMGDKTTGSVSEAEMQAAHTSWIIEVLCEISFSASLVPIPPIHSGLHETQPLLQTQQTLSIINRQFQWPATCIDNDAQGTSTDLDLYTDPRLPHPYVQLAVRA